MNFGIREESGIGALLQTPIFSDIRHYLGRMAFDVTYYMIIIVIFLSVVSGIIIGKLENKKTDLSELLHSEMTHHIYFFS